MDLFLWELGTPALYLIWFAVFAAQMLVAEVNRRWNWTIFALWSIGGVALMPYAAVHGTPMVGWFPFGKYAIMVVTATANGVLIWYGKRYPEKARRYVVWFGLVLWLGLAANIMEANIRDVSIFLQRDVYYACGADWTCLQQVNATHSIDMINGLPETRGVTAALHSPEWYQAVSANLQANHVGIDPATGFRTIGGYWNLLSAAAGMLNIITITGLGKAFITSNPQRKTRGLIWVDMVWPWVIAYDLWNHAFLYNSLSDYTWYCTLALLLSCTIPAFTWAKGQWIWFRCYTLMFWIAANNLIPELLVPPSSGMVNFSTMKPSANIACAVAALVANVLLFAYWAYKILKHKRNPLTGCLYMELSEFRTIMRQHADDKDKYWVTDRVPETPTELGFEPQSPTPPADGYVSWMPWWKSDHRYPKPRTPLSSDAVLVEKGITSDPQWDVPTKS